MRICGLEFENTIAISVHLFTVKSSLQQGGKMLLSAQVFEI